MKKELISDKEGIAIIVLFLSGSTSIFVTGLDAKKDLWMAIIVAVIMVIPMITIFARLHQLYPDKDLFDIIESCFGKYFGKLIILVFTWYTFYWAADVLNNYGFFIERVSLNQTPKILTILFLGGLCTWVIKIGIEVLGRWSELFLMIAIIFILITIFLMGPEMNVNNIRPVLEEGIRPVLKGAYSVFTQPFIQTVAFTMAFSSLKSKKSSYTIYYFGLTIGSILTLLISLTSILVIGAEEATASYYPSYITITRMDIGGLVQRLEVVIAIVFVLGGFIKISILILCTCKGVSKVIGYNDYRFILIPISLLIINLSYFQYDNVMHYFRFNSDIWAVYFFPFHIILPIIIWVMAEIKKKRLKKTIV